VVVSLLVLNVVTVPAVVLNTVEVLLVVLNVVVVPKEVSCVPEIKVV
tara:strand:+ start:1243 stop:1383 length:141 start_codon:yes stop_codon:yes gene_type:complete